jgi:16S rRNA (guanine527-N7)-methyltransferase
MPEQLTLPALCRRHRIPEDGERRLGSLARLVVSDPLAPTRIRDPARVLDDHLADSLVALELEVVRQAGAIADLGAGAGFPGLALAIALPSSEVSLVESSARKCEFIARAAELCGIGNATAVPARAESWAEGLGRCDLVVARALAPLAVVAEYAAPLLVDGGSLVAWRGRRDEGDERAGARAAAELGLAPSPPVHVVPYPRALHRHLHVMVKVGPTPPRFPRRPGAARKRPLGSTSSAGPI